MSDHVGHAVRASWSKGVDLVGRRAVVAGAGVAGLGAARALRAAGIDVTVADLRAASAPADAGSAAPDAFPRMPDDAILPPDTALVVTSPGWRPDAPLLTAAARAGIPVWGDVELAWRQRPAGQRWLAITGTNGKTTTTGMLAAILDAAGIRATSAGNIGIPITDVVRVDPPYDLLAVELSSFQLYWSSTLAPYAAAVLNIAEDHLDWHGSMAAYAQAKNKVFGPETVAVYDADDSGARALVASRPGAIGVTRRSPARGMLGVEDSWLVDRAFGGGRLAAVADLRVPGPHNLTDALVAAALARSVAVPPSAIAAGLASYLPEAHRMALVGTVGDVQFIDDSKGTNPHATAAALAAYPEAVWIAGGLAKGATFDDLVRDHGGRLRGAILIGTCAQQIAQALARHAAHVPVIQAVDLDNAVREAARLAQPSGIVLLSPAAASMDMFDDYKHRGVSFAAAVKALGASTLGR